MTQPKAPLLAVRDIEVIYEGVILAVRGISLEVAPGSVVALLGANGAGKTTTLKAISGLLGAERGEVARGEIVYDGQTVGHVLPHRLVAGGLVQVLEGRHCFPHLTVEENLVSGGLILGLSRREQRDALDRIYTFFPRLALLRTKQTGYASGGEQQMVAIGRALMARPKLVLLDEPSMGLAPLIVEEIFGIVRTLNREDGVAFLLAEQNATQALRIADHGYIVENGRIATSGPAAEMIARDDVKSFYLGVGSEGRRSFRAPQFDRPVSRAAAR